MPDNAALIDKLMKAWRFFFAKGFIDGFGHISARTADPDRILVSRHNLGRAVRAEDFVLVDLEGRQIETTAPLPGELPIHLEIYRRRSDVGSIAHFHATFSTSFSMSSQELWPTYFPAAIYRRGVPIHPDSRLVNTKERGIALAETLGAHRAALLKAHGIVVTGADVEEMVASVFILEDNAYRTWVAASMGEVDRLSEELLAEIEDELLKSRGPFRRIWALCESYSDECVGE
jgi:ribulose-5-phosphate 4-epimerase/fuculose-1-phosphate aldolase